jgi:hypothetical protein
MPDTHRCTSKFSVSHSGCDVFVIDTDPLLVPLCHVHRFPSLTPSLMWARLLLPAAAHRIEALRLLAEANQALGSGLQDGTNGQSLDLSRETGNLSWPKSRGF